MVFFAFMFVQCLCHSNLASVPEVFGILFDEVVLPTQLVTNQNGAQQTAVRFFNRNISSHRATAKLFHYQGFMVTGKK